MFKSKQISIIILLLFILPPCYAFSSNDEETAKVPNDSLSILRKKYKDKTTAEKLISMPGFIAYAPLKIVFEGQKFLVRQAFEGNFLAKVLDILTTDDGKRGILPTYSSSAGGGLKLFQRGLISANSKLSLSATVGLRERFRYQLRFKRLEFGKKVNAELLAKYHFQSDESFYGMGRNTDTDDRTNYAHELVVSDVNLGFQLNEQNRIGILIGFESNDILRGRNETYPSTTDVTAFSSLPAIESVVSLGKLELELRHDSRDHPGRPTSGFKALLRGTLYQETNDDQYGFSRIAIDVSRYFHLFYYRTLKFRFAAEVTRPTKDRQIPFYYLSEIGRSETVRGFARGRFRDRDMILGSIEYVYPIWESINAQLFLDGGTVAKNIADRFDTDHLRIGYGVGFQYWSTEEVVFDMSVARSEDGLRFYLGLNKSL